MSERLDLILDLLDQATQRSTEGAMAASTDECWRCLGPPGSGSSGVCPACRAELLDEIPVEALVGPYPDRRLDLDVDDLDALVEAGLRAITPFVEACRQLVEAFTVAAAAIHAAWSPPAARPSTKPVPAKASQQRRYPPRRHR